MRILRLARRRFEPVIGPTDADLRMDGQTRTDRRIEAIAERAALEESSTGTDKGRDLAQFPKEIDLDSARPIAGSQAVAGLSRAVIFATYSMKGACSISGSKR